MNPSLETILKRMERSGHSEAMLVADLVADMLASQGNDQSDEDLTQQIDDSMDELIASAQIIQGWVNGTED